MDQDPRYKELVENLTQKTKTGKLKWEPTVSDNTFVASIFGEYSLTLEADNYIYLTLRDAYDREIFRVGNHQIIELTELFEIAREQALKVNETVDKLLEKLKVM